MTLDNVFSQTERYGLEWFSVRLLIKECSMSSLQGCSQTKNEQTVVELVYISILGVCIYLYPYCNLCVLHETIVYSTPAIET